MKVAVCLSGLIGSLTGKWDKTIEDCANPKISHKTFRECILSYNKDVDVFIHTWSIDKKHTLIELYNPKSISAESQNLFNKGQLSDYGLPRRSKHKQYRFNSFSKWNSLYKTLKLKHECETDNSFKYDCVFVSRLDMIYLTPIDFAKFDMSKFYILEDAKVARHNYRGLGENRYNDNAFFSNSILIGCLPCGDFLPPVSFEYFLMLG